MKKFAKRLFLAFFLCGLLCGRLSLGFAQSMKIKGSDTIYPLMVSLNEVYHDEKKSSVKIEIDGGGSGTGIKALQNQEVDVAMASRAIKDAEKKKLGSYEEVVIAYDALSIIVNPRNPVEALSKAQLKDIFTGKIKNWQQLGGKDLPIAIYTRFNTSGTFDFMIDKVMDGAEFSQNAEAKSSNAGIVHSVSENPASIGFVGLAYIEDVVKPVSVAFKDKNYVKPTFKNAIDRKYPIVRKLFLYCKKEAGNEVKSFIDFIKTPLGQKVVTHKGYIPANL